VSTGKDLRVGRDLRAGAILGRSALVGDAGRAKARFESARRVFRILDLVSRREGLTAKMLARELGVSLSTCYYLLDVLIEEGYLERISSRRGYRLGPAVPALHERYSRNDPSSAVEPVLDELAQRSKRHAYFGVLSEGAVTVTHVKSPQGSPPVGIVRGFHGASHGLALGKVLLAGTGAEGVRTYVEEIGLEAFTPRTIIQPALFELHLDRVRERGLATDVEEFAENLCCVAMPVVGRGDDEVEGAVRVPTSARRFEGEARSLVELVRWAAGEASALLPKEGCQR
jgi:DNA-binding IclR family transcriptional regulator